MKKVILILCGTLWAITACAQVAGGQIVRKRTPNVAQSPNKSTSQNASGMINRPRVGLESHKTVSSRTHNSIVLESDDRFFRYALVGNQNIFDKLVYGFREGLALVIYDGKYGFIDKGGHN